MEDKPDHQNQASEPKTSSEVPKPQFKPKSGMKDWKPLGHVRDSFAEHIWQDRESFRR